jgi:hypothetical protein
MRRFALATLVLASTACGRDLVVLHVTSSTLSAPADINALLVTTSTQGDATPLRVQNIELGKDDKFPLDILLRIDDDVPHDLHHQVEALNGADVVRTAGADGTWKEHHTEHVTVSLDP